MKRKLEQDDDEAQGQTTLKKKCTKSVEDDVCFGEFFLKRFGLKSSEIIEEYVNIGMVNWPKKNQLADWGGPVGSHRKAF